MSHFKVYVVTESGTEEELKKALQPFHEFECTGDDDQYIQEIDITEEARTDYINYYKKDYNSFYSYLLEYCEYYGISQLNYKNNIFNKEKAKYNYFIYDETLDIVKVIKRTNPNKKWDYWIIGGRFRDSLILKNGVSKGNNFQKKDINFVKMKQKLLNYFSKNWDLADALVTREDKENFENWKSLKERFENIDKARDYYYAQSFIQKIKQHDSNLYWSEYSDSLVKSKEEYLNICYNNNFGAFAFLQNGKWYEKGKMGWWGNYSLEDHNWAQILENLIENVPDDNYITVIDCHI